MDRAGQDVNCPLCHFGYGGFSTLRIELSTQNFGQHAHWQAVDMHACGRDGTYQRTYASPTLTSGSRAKKKPQSTRAYCCENVSAYGNLILRVLSTLENALSHILEHPNHLT